MPDRAISVPQATQIAQATKRQLTELNERLDGLGDGVPTEVRQALLTLFRSAAYAETGLTDEIAVIESWAAVVTAIALNQTSISISGASTNQLVATTTPAGGTVTWASSDTSVTTVSSSGLVTGVGNGTATITASCGGKTATCSVTVSGFASLTGITATYTQSGTVYNTDTLDSLKSDLVVTAAYSDSTTRTLSDSDYTLSGTLEVGTSAIVASYGGKTDTFNVTVTLYESWDYEWYASSGVAPAFMDYDTITFAQDNSYATIHTKKSALFSVNDVGDMEMEFAVGFPDGSYNNNPQFMVRTSSTGGFKMFPSSTDGQVTTNISGSNASLNISDRTAITIYKMKIENGTCTLKYGISESSLTTLTGAGQTNSQYYTLTGIAESATNQHNIDFVYFKYRKNSQ